MVIIQDLDKHGLDGVLGLNSLALIIQHQKIYMMPIFDVILTASLHDCLKRQTIHLLCVQVKQIPQVCF